MGLIRLGIITQSKYFPLENLRKVLDHLNLSSDEKRPILLETLKDFVKNQLKSQGVKDINARILNKFEIDLPDDLKPEIHSDHLPSTASDAEVFAADLFENDDKKLEENGSDEVCQNPSKESDITKMFHQILAEYKIVQNRNDERQSVLEQDLTRVETEVTKKLSVFDSSLNDTNFRCEKLENSVKNQAEFTESLLLDFVKHKKEVDECVDKSFGYIKEIVEKVQKSVSDVRSNVLAVKSQVEDRQTKWEIEFKSLRDQISDENFHGSGVKNETPAVIIAPLIKPRERRTSEKSDQSGRSSRKSERKTHSRRAKRAGSSCSAKSDSDEEYKYFRIPRHFGPCDGNNEEAFLDWLAKIERTSETSKWSDKYKCFILANLVEGRAAAAFDKIVPENRLIWSVLKQKLVSSLVPKQHFERLQSDLKRNFQKTSESVRDFNMVFRERVRKAYASENPGFSEKFLVEIYIDLLSNDDVRLEVARNHYQKIDEAMNCAESESSLRECISRKSRIQIQPRIAALNTNGVERVKPQVFEPPCSPQKPVFRCYRCKQEGHIQRNCQNQFVPDARQNQYQNSGKQNIFGKYCFICNSREHSSLDCSLRKNTNFTSSPKFQSQQFQPRNSLQSGPPCPVTATSSSAESNPALYPNCGNLSTAHSAERHPLIHIFLGESLKRVVAFADSGSDMSLIHQRVLNSMKISGEKLIEKRTEISSMYTLNGFPLKILSQTEITARTSENPSESMNFAGNFLVTDDMPYDMLLGQDIMDSEYIVPDIHHKIVWIKKSPVLFIENENKNLVCGCLISSAEDVFIPARHSVFVNGVTSVKTNNVDAVFIPSGPDFSEGKNSHLIVESVVRIIGGKIPVQIFNLLDEPVKVKKNEILGHLEPYSLILPKTCNVLETEIPSELCEKDNSLEKLLQDTFNISNSNANLSEDQKKSLVALLSENEHLFYEVSGKIGRTHLVKHKIDTGDSNPVNQPLRRFPEKLRHVIDEEVEKMQKSGFVQSSQSPYRSNILMVSKKDGSLRPCVDFRMLNAVTKKDVYPLPRIDETLECLGKAQFFTTLDLASGYWQVELEKSSQEKTAFATRKGLFEFSVMPFGLCNAPSTFQRLMDLVLSGFQWDFCVVYLDDIVIFSKTWEEHLNHIQEIFDRISGANLTLKMSKCQFGREQVPFLGHIVSKQGIQADPKKIQAIVDWPNPKNKEEVVGFLGLCGYYRRFCENFSEKASPLLEISKPKGRPFMWTADQEKSFQCLKNEATNFPILRYPDFEKLFVVYTDASENGLGAVLGQYDESGEWVISYASRVLTEAERRYHINDKEILAVHWAVHKIFRPYIYGRNFDLITDSSAVFWFRGKKDGSPRLMRWQTDLNQYTFSVYQRKSKSHCNADALSRRNEPPKIVWKLTDPTTNLDICSEKVVCASIAVSDSKNSENTEKTDFETKLPSWKKEQFSDPYCRKFLLFLLKNKLPEDPVETREVNIRVKDFVIGEDGQLYRIVEHNKYKIDYQLVVPESKREELLWFFHDSFLGGHFGKIKTYRNIVRKYWWPSMSVQIHDWVEKCKNCQQVKNTSKIAPLQSIPVGEIFSRIAIDIAQLPLTTQGNKYVIVCTEYASRWVIAKPIPDMTAETVAKFILVDVVCQHGVPSTILTDQGTQFTSEVITNLCKLLQIQQSFTTVFHPQSDGLCERFNRTMFQMLAAGGLELNDEWDTLLPFIVLAYNTSEQSSTLAPPFELVYGREVSLPVDLIANRQVDPDVFGNFDPNVIRQRLLFARKLAVENISKAQARQSSQYNKKSVENSYEIGQKVWFWNTKRLKGVKGKLSPRWIGPFVTVKRESNVNYRIRPLHVRGNDKVVHLNLLSKFSDKNSEKQPETTKNPGNVEMVKPDRRPLNQWRICGAVAGDLVIVKPEKLPYCPAIIVPEVEQRRHSPTENEVVVKVLGSNMLVKVRTACVYQYTPQNDTELDRVAKTRMARKALQEARIIAENQKLWAENISIE